MCAFDIVQLRTQQQPGLGVQPKPKAEAVGVFGHDQQAHRRACRYAVVAGELDPVAVGHFLEAAGEDARVGPASCAVEGEVVAGRQQADDFVADAQYFPQRAV